VIKKNLTAYESCYWEKYYLEYFNSLGFSCINKAKTGIHSSSLGGDTIIWTYSKSLLYSMIFTKLSDLKNNYASCYAAMRQRGWLTDILWVDVYNNSKTKQCQEKISVWPNERILLFCNLFNTT